MQNINFTLVEAFSIILSVVSLIITIVGFFASLKFYRDGVQLQEKANDALTKINERTQFIQSQVGGMFDKTLDAAIGKREALTESFSELSEQLENTKSKIIEATLSQIDEAGEQERKRLKDVVDSQLKLIQDQIEITKESVKDIASEPPAGQLPYLGGEILNMLYQEKDGLSVSDLISRLNKGELSITHSLHQLHQHGLVEMIRKKPGKGTVFIANPNVHNKSV